MSQRSTRRTIALTVATLLATPAAAAHAAQHWTPGVSLDPAAGVTPCLAATPDGALITWRTGHRLRLANLSARPPVDLASERDWECPAVAGDGVVSALAVNGSAHRPVQVAAGGSLAPFADGSLGDDGSAEPDGSGTLATGGGAIAVGLRRPENDSALPVLALRPAGSALAASIILPGGASNWEAPGPLVGLDGTGRGVVVWSAGPGLLAATFSADGVLSAPQTLAPSGSDKFAPIRVAVGPDGRASVAWVADRRLVVATGTTVHGLDLGGAASTSVADAVAIEPDGAAVGVDVRSARDGIRGTLRIVTRAAGQRFARPRRYRTRELGDPRLAPVIADGRVLVLFSTTTGGEVGTLDSLSAVYGSVSDLPAKPLSVPVASGRVGELVAAIPPEGPPAILTVMDRAIESLARGIRHARREVTVYRLERGPAPTPRGLRMRIARDQRLGRPQALTLGVRCPVRCSVRVAGEVGQLGMFDSSLTLAGGVTHRVRIPYTAGGGSSVGRPLRRSRRVTVGIGIDTPEGELRVTRRLRVRP